MSVGGSAGKSETATPPEKGVPERCANCGAAVPERFCGACGQERARDLHVPFHRLAGEAVAEAFTLDSRLARTLGPLLVRPGDVTRAYLEGKRARYTSPVKLYLLASFVFFAVSALRPGEALEIRVSAEDAEELATARDDLGSLRELGPAGARVADRLEALEREPPEEVRRRLAAGFADNVPVAMFFLVPAMALLLRLLFRSAGLFFAEHAVFALHAHAVAFALLLPGAALGHGGLRAAGLAADAVHLVVAARRLYRRGWAATVARAAAVIALYGVALGVALAAVLALALARA
jgi:hypothetical protein